MREIKFRGISRETNQFVYGMLMYSASDSGLIIVETCEAPPSTQDPCGDTVNIYHGIKKGTEGQFTELKDKSIFEGDIFHLGDPNIKYVVEWFDCGLKGRQIGNMSSVGLVHWEHSIEVIGNIHKNPELLES